MGRPLAIGLAALVSLAVLAPSATATFPGQNGSIVFSAGVPGDDSEIYTVDPAGVLTQLTQDSPDPYLSDLTPAFSADGRRIVWARQRQIFVMDADGSDKAVVAPELNGHDPAFSPDGKRIVFVLGLDPYSSGPIVAMDVDGSHQQAIGAGANPSYSYDGSKIVFTRGEAPARQIAIMNPDGTDVTTLTDGTADAVSPSRSPDGNRIAFVRQPPQAYSELVVMDADGTHENILVASLARAPVVSPDGSEILFTRPGPSPLEGSELRLVPAEGGATTATPSFVAYPSTPDWQPVGPVVELTVRRQTSTRHVTATLESRFRDATVTLDGTIRVQIPGGSSKPESVQLRATTIQADADAPVRVEVQISRAGRTLLKQALDSGRRPRGKLTMKATDADGLTSSGSQPIRYKPKT